MKKYIIYVTGLLLVLLSSACSKEQTGAEGIGTLSMTISTTRAADNTYDPMQHLVVRIWNSEGGLLRKYSSQESIPASLELMSGDYKITVEAGEAEAAGFEKRFYKGESTFTVTAGATVNAQVVCRTENAIASVRFDESITENFGTNATVWIAAGDADSSTQIAADELPSLSFTEDGVGYFTMPEGVTTLSWVFEGTHNEDGEMTKCGQMTDVKAGGKYIFTFRYSPDLPGYLGCFLIRIDPKTDDHDDTLIFSPDPTIEGIGFNMKQTQNYIPGKTGDMQYAVTSMGIIKNVKVTIDGQTYDAFDNTVGVSVIPDGNYALTLVLSNGLFTGRSGGVHTVTFNITDVDGGALTTTSQYQLQGIMPTTAADCDLWTNTVTLRALILDPEVTAVKFGLRSGGGAWREANGVKGNDGNFSGTITAEWAQSTNANGLTIHTPVPGTGVFANNSYESRSIIYGNESVTTFTTQGGQVIPDGDMENGSLGCFTNNSGPFWGSGNNSISAALCYYSTFSGMQGSHCAYLKSNKPPLLVNLAAGNLFTGDFVQAGTGGTVSFGRKYEWTARPKGISLLYWGKIGNVNQNQHGGPLSTGSPDKARVYVVLINWSSRHDVKSGSSSPTGTWDPAKVTSTSEGQVIACGSVFMEGTSSGSSMTSLTIPIEYYDKVTKPTGNYTLIISCSCSAYGDFMNGCTSNEMYVDDFKWVY